MKKTAILNINQFQHGINLDDFYANTIENHLVTSHKDIELPHKHDFYLAILFTKGSGIHEIDFTSYNVKPGSLFFLNPGQTHHWILSQDIKGYIFFHTQAFYDLYYTQNHIHQFPFFYSMHSSPVIYLNNTDSISITQLFKNVLKENKEDNLLKRDKTMTLIQEVYIESTRIYAQENDVDSVQHHSSYYTKFLKLEELIESLFITEKSPSVYAEKLNMSPKHLNRITQAVAGKTATDVILDRVLLEAKKELILQYRNFNEIAYALGYEDYAYFSRLFKKKTAETPSEFIAKYKRR